MSMTAKEFSGLMMRLQHEFGPVGVPPQPAPAAAVPSTSSIPAAPAPSTSTSPEEKPALKIKAEHGDPFQVQLIAKRIVEGDEVM